MTEKSSQDNQPAKFVIERLNPLPQVALIYPVNYAKDNRGLFAETFRVSALPEVRPFVQTNISLSTGFVLRGLHFQHPRPQGKLIQLIKGRIFDVAVDLRTGSQTFGQHVHAILDETRPGAIWIPPGFAHGFMTFDSGAIIAYSCDEYHDPVNDRVLAWNDPKLNIPWPAGRLSTLIMSAKDRNAPRLDEIDLD